MVWSVHHQVCAPAPLQRLGLTLRCRPQLGNVGDDGKYGTLVVELQEEEHPKGFYRTEDRPEDVRAAATADASVLARAALTPIHRCTWISSLSPRIF